MTDLSPLVIGYERGSRSERVLDASSRARHLAIFGQTGTGKTTLFEHLIAQDMATPGLGLALLDPHGDLAHAVLKHLPHERTNDLVFLDPSDRTRPVSFNILDDVPEHATARTVESVVSACIHIWGESAIGPQTQMVLRNSLHALIEAKDQSILAVPRLLSDDAFRNRIVQRIHDPKVIFYWRSIYDHYDDTQRAHIIAPLQNKLDALLTPDLRPIIGQSKSSIHLKRIMDEGRLFIARLPKGEIGEEPARILGAFLTTAISNAALSRASVPEEERRPFVLYADEFGSFASGGFSLILSEARKYKLSLVIGSQFLQQIEKVDGLKEAVFGNVGSMIVFRVGSEDALTFAHHLELGLIEAGTNHLYVDPLQLQHLPNFEAIGRFLIDGIPTRALELSMYLPPPAINHRPQRAVTHSRERFGRERARVIGAIERFFVARHDANPARRRR